MSSINDIPWLIEKVADLEHTQWAAWTSYMLDNLTEENIERWRQQIATEYQDLTNTEKDSDREWAVRTVAVVHEHMEESNGTQSNERR